MTYFRVTDALVGIYPKQGSTKTIAQQGRSSIFRWQEVKFLIAPQPGQIAFLPLLMHSKTCGTTGPVVGILLSILHPRVGSNWISFVPDSERMRFRTSEN
jgi:hypothetical protein